MPKSWEFITPVTAELKAALDALHPVFIKEAEAGGRKVLRAETVQTHNDLYVLIHFQRTAQDTSAHDYAYLDRAELRKLGARPAEI